MIGMGCDRYSSSRCACVGYSLCRRLSLRYTMPLDCEITALERFECEIIMRDASCEWFNHTNAVIIIWLGRAFTFTSRALILNLAERRILCRN